MVLNMPPADGAMRNPLSRRRSRPLLGVVLALATALLLTAGSSTPPTLPELNERVLAFARANLGKSVGDGSCITLAIVAMKEAGATSHPSFDPGGDFVWGRPVDSFREAMPGDILQFHKAVFRGKRTLTKNRWVSWHQEYPHHTAIVSRMSEGGNVVTVLHQNVVTTTTKKGDRDSKHVQEATLRMDSLQEGGWIRIYRPVAARDRAADDRRRGGRDAGPEVDSMP